MCFEEKLIRWEENWSGLYNQWHSANNYAKSKGNNTAMDMEIEDSSPIDDLKLQKLDTNVYFGPCEILTQPILLQYENIKFIIGVNLSTEKIASFYTQYFRNSNSVVVNLCSPTTAAVATKKAAIDLYIRNNTILLQKFVGQYLQMGKKIKKSLTQAQTDTIQSLPQFCNSNVLSGEPLVQYQAFNDLLALFKSFSHFGNILVISSHSYDCALLKFLISRVMTYYPLVTIQDSLQYMKATLNISISTSDEFDILNDKELWEFGQTQEILKRRQTSSVKRRCVNLPENSTIDNRMLMGTTKRGRFWRALGSITFLIITTVFFIHYVEIIKCYRCSILKRWKKNSEKK